MGELSDKAETEIDNSIYYLILDSVFTNGQFSAGLDEVQTSLVIGKFIVAHFTTSSPPTNLRSIDSEESFKAHFR